MSKEEQRGSLAPGGKAAPVDAFLDEVNRGAGAHARSPRGRLVFALDATMSRQPTWDLAHLCRAACSSRRPALGGLDVQLVYFRGFGECRASRFVSGGQGLAALMAKIDCRGGHTQIGKVLRHVRDEAKRARVGALVYVGDAMEERLDELCAIAGELGLLGVKAFMFHEGDSVVAANAFREIARLTGGAYAAFDASAPARLAALLAAAAAYAAGGPSPSSAKPPKVARSAALAVPNALIGSDAAARRFSPPLYSALLGLRGFTRVPPALLARLSRRFGGIIRIAVGLFLVAARRRRDRDGGARREPLAARLFRSERPDRFSLGWRRPPLFRNFTGVT